MTDNIRNLVKAGATDFRAFTQGFFPDVFTQRSPAFHAQIWKLLSDPAFSRVAIKVFRGGAKTVITRAQIARRICYGLTNFAVPVSASEDNAVKHVRWIRSQIERQTLWARTFGLTQGPTWKENEISIYHHKIDGADGPVPIYVKAVGLRGQVRGLNLDGRRPDFIMADDCEDEENTSTPEQRRKVAELVLGALQYSMTSRDENINSKMVVLQTPLHPEDLIEGLIADASWKSLTVSCFGDDGESVWPEKYSTETLHAMKATAKRQGLLSTWMREMEVKAVSSEIQSFNMDWFRYYEDPPVDLTYVVGVDPAPAIGLDELNTKRGRDKDYQALVLLGIAANGNRYVIDVVQSKTDDHQALINQLFLWNELYSPVVFHIETNGYQKVLAEILHGEFERRKTTLPIVCKPSTRRKADRIVQDIRSIASTGRLWLRNDMQDLRSDLRDYPQVRHDDALDALALAISAARTLVPQQAPSQFDFNSFDTETRIVSCP